METRPWKVLGEAIKAFIAPWVVCVSLGSIALYLPATWHSAFISPLLALARTWPCWEGKESVTYLSRIRGGGTESRKLVTLPRGQVQKTELTAYEPILRVLFATGTP